MMTDGRSNIKEIVSTTGQLDHVATTVLIITLKRFKERRSYRFIRMLLRPLRLTVRKSVLSQRQTL